MNENKKLNKEDWQEKQKRRNTTHSSTHRQGNTAPCARCRGS